MNEQPIRNGKKPEINVTFKFIFSLKEKVANK